MPVKMNGQPYYRTAEVCQMVGISKSTFFRWTKEDVISEAQQRDRKGWRLFAEDEIDKLRGEVNKIQTNHTAQAGKIPVRSEINQRSE